MAHDTGKTIRKIVSVEDDASMIDLFKLILKPEGFEVLGATSGLEGLKLIKSTKPDLVLLDLILPEMDGWEVYQRIKADEAIYKTPIIIVSVKEKPTYDGMFVTKIGPDPEYIVKPFFPRALIATIHKVLRDPA